MSGLSATLTINLNSDVLQLAEQEARARHTTLPEVVAQQLRVMARNWEESKAGRTPVTDSLRDAVKLPPDFDERTALTEELQKKRPIQHFPASEQCAYELGIGFGGVLRYHP